MLPCVDKHIAPAHHHRRLPLDPQRCPFRNRDCAAPIVCGSASTPRGCRTRFSSASPTRLPRTSHR